LKIGLGLILLAGIAPMIMPRHPLGGGWTGMIGLILLLHFGLFHLLSILWRRTDVDAPPIMSAPVLARSIGDFWNARWNMGFHVLASKYLFNPIRRRFGATAGLIGTFIVSGFLHDLVITLPARGGYGLPTAYFAIQGMGILAERLPSVRKLARQHPWAGRMMTLVIVAGPVGLLFPAVFVHRVIVPFLNAIGIY
jgi:alginate O-acetyltransferase complex protein AlgI